MTPEEIIEMVRISEIDHNPLSYPAVQQKVLSRAADLLEAQSLEINRLRAAFATLTAKLNFVHNDALIMMNDWKPTNCSPKEGGAG